MAGLQVAVGVPRAGAAVAAVEDLHEAHALLDEPAGGQALLAERFASRFVEAVDCCVAAGLGGKIDRRRERPSACGRRARSCECGRAAPGRRDIRLPASRLRLAQQREFRLLLFAEDVGCRARRRAAGSSGRSPAARRGARGRDNSRRAPCTPPQQSAIGVPRTTNCGKIVVERAQAVMDPRADRGKLPFERVPAGVELKLRAVIVVGGPHRADDRQVVGAARRRAATSR